jgi:hypothetical protein
MNKLFDSTGDNYHPAPAWSDPMTTITAALVQTLHETKLATALAEIERLNAEVDRMQGLVVSQANDLMTITPIVDAAKVWLRCYRGEGSRGFSDLDAMQRWNNSIHTLAELVDPLEAKE